MYGFQLYYRYNECKKGGMGIRSSQPENAEVSECEPRLEGRPPVEAAEGRLSVSKGGAEAPEESQTV